MQRLEVSGAVRPQIVVVRRQRVNNITVNKSIRTHSTAADTEDGRVSLVSLYSPPIDMTHKHGALTTFVWSSDSFHVTVSSSSRSSK